MSDAGRDANRVTTLLGVSSLNFLTPTTLSVDPNTHELLVQATSSLPTGASTSTAQTDGTQQTKIKETVPTDATKTNPSLVLTYTGSNLTTIQKVISGVTYSKSLTYDGSGNLTGVSVWS
jgi:hypothetical protein